MAITNMSDEELLQDLLRRGIPMGEALASLPPAQGGQATSTEGMSPEMRGALDLLLPNETSPAMAPTSNDTGALEITPAAIANAATPEVAAEVTPQVALAAALEAIENQNAGSPAETAPPEVPATPEAILLEAIEREAQERQLPRGPQQQQPAAAVPAMAPAVDVPALPAPVLAQQAAVTGGGGVLGGGILNNPAITQGPPGVLGANPEKEGEEDDGGFLSRLLSPTLPEGMNWKDTLFNMGVGMMMSDGNTFQKIGTGLSRASLYARQKQEDARKNRQEDRQARFDEQQQRMNELKIQQVERDLETGNVQHLGNGILWDFTRQQQVAPELADMVLRQKEREMATRAHYAQQSQSFSPGRYSTNYFYNEQQEPVFWRTNDRSGQVEYLVNDQWTTERPEGSLVRPEDSVVKHTNRIDGKRFEEIAEAGTAARSTMGTISEMRRVLNENPDLYTGAGAGTFDGMRRWAMAMGLGGDRADKVASFDELRNLTMNLVLNRVGETKGAISDREMAAFERSVPSLTQTREGMERTIAIMERAAQRAMEMDDFFSARMHHMPYYQIKEQWDAYINANDAISDLIPEDGGGGATGQTSSGSSGGGFRTPRGNTFTFE